MIQRPKQHTGAPTIEAPNGMIFTVAAAVWPVRLMRPRAVMAASLTMMEVIFVSRFGVERRREEGVDLLSAIGCECSEDCV